MSPRLILTMVLAAIAAGCGPTTKPDPLPRDLMLAGSTQFVGLGGTSQWTVVFRLTDFSETNVTGEVTWTSSDPKVASMSPGGLLTAAGFGSTVISANYQSRSAQRTVQVSPVTAIGLGVTTSLSFSAVGETRQLVAVVRYNDGTTVDVSADTQWDSSEASIAAVTPSGVLTTTGFGAVTITAQYGAMGLTALVTVLPPGTFVASGRVRLPGAGGEGANLGVPDFKITNTDYGNTALSNPQGQYSIAAVAVGTHLLLEKAGFETTEFLVTGPAANPTVQKLIRVLAGESVTTFIYENDISYDPSPAFHCDNCRLIRVVSPAAGTLHVQFDWTRNAAPVLWANGATFPTTGTRQLLADVPVDAGESLLYIRAGTGNYLDLALTTSFSATPGGGFWE